VTTSDLLLAVLQKYNVHMRVRAITSDSGLEMPPAMERLCQKLNAAYAMRLEEDWNVRYICHVLNRAAVDAEKRIKHEMAVVRDLLKDIRYCGTMREEFANIRVRFGFQKKPDVPNLDAESRWNSMFDMVDSC
jgi:hypothetical protein